MWWTLPLKSEQLLNEVWRYAAMSENVDSTMGNRNVIIWDNRRVLHRQTVLINLSGV